MAISRHILVVDDDRTNRMMITYRLQAGGHQPASAENGVEALAALKESHFDLVLLDLLMPDMDGYTTLQMIKKDSELQSTPVIMMSAVGEMDSVVRCLELGAEDYLAKPVDPLVLASRINGILAREDVQKIQADFGRVIERLADSAKAAGRGELPTGALDDLVRDGGPIGRLADEIQRFATAEER